MTIQDTIRVVDIAMRKMGPQSRKVLLDKLQWVIDQYRLDTSKPIDLRHPVGYSDD